MMQPADKHRHQHKSKSNANSMERAAGREQIVVGGGGHSHKRGAITAAQNSPRQALNQLKSMQPRIPDTTSAASHLHQKSVV